jgi:hypothetical protein
MVYAFNETQCKSISTLIPQIASMIILQVCLSVKACDFYLGGARIEPGSGKRIILNDYFGGFPQFLHANSVIAP